jgi:uncharacterized membrane protein
MKITIISVGKLKEKYLVEGIKEYSKNKKNRLILLNEERIYVGIITAFAVAILFSIFELLELYLESKFKIIGSTFILIKIGIICILLSLYTNYLQHLKFKKDKKTNSS